MAKAWAAEVKKARLYMMKIPWFLLFCGLALPFPAAGADSGAAPGGLEDYFCREIKKPFFAEAGKGEFAAQRSAALPEKFRMPKPAGVKRVFILGESVAAILGPGTPAARGRGGPEIINCGMGGYNSFRIYGVFREVLNYSPDLLVVLSGNNEVPPEDLCSGAGFELRRRKFRLLEWYYSLTEDAQQARKKASLKMHGDLLGKMAREAKKAGVPVIFATLPVNVGDMSSLLPMPFENELFAAGYRFYYEKNFPAAAEKFRLGLLAEPHDHFLNFYAAKTLEKLGRKAEAAALFFKALDLDADMTRATPARNALIRRVAGSEGVCVADLEKLFYGAAPGGVTGFEEFVDGVHWRPALNKTVWTGLSRSAAACGIKGFEYPGPADNGGRKETPREAALKRLSYALSWLDGKGLNAGALAELAFIRETLPGLTREASVSVEKLDTLLLHNFWSAGTAARLKEIFPDLLAHLAETERRLGNYSTARVLCDRALALKPGVEYFRLVRAQALAGLGSRKAAEKEFSGCGPAGAARALGLAYGFSPAGAAAAPTQNGKLEALMNLCLTPAGGKNMAAALQACQSVSYLLGSGEAEAPRGADTLGSDASFQSYRLLMALGRKEEAREVLRWTVGNAPAAWPELAAAQKELAAAR